MSLNITSIANQYLDYAGYYLKAYDIETNKPKAIYFDDRKLSGALKVKLNKDGLFISDGGANIIPHVEGYYNLFVFKTKKEADENDFTNAISLGDRLIAEISGENITKASETEYGSIRFAKDNELFIGGAFPDSVAVESSKITRMGEISAEEQKAVEDDLIARDNTKWLSPDDINYMITEFGAPNQEREQLPIGTTIWMDKETAKTRDDLLPQNNELFDPVEYPLLAAKSGYSQVGSTSVDGFSNPLTFKNGDIATSSADYMRVAKYNNEYYMYADTTSGYHIFKSTDALNWTQISSETTYLNSQYAQMIFDNQGYLYIMGGNYYSVFDVNTNTYYKNYQRLVIDFNIEGLDYSLRFNNLTNEIIVVFLRNDASVNKFTIVKTTDGFDNITQSVINFDPSYKFSNTPGINSADSIFNPSVDFYNGKYYYIDYVNKNICELDEDNEILNIIFNFTPTLPITIDSSPSYTGNMLQCYINKKGHLVAIIARDDTNNQIEFLYSEDRINFTNKILTFNHNIDNNFSNKFAIPVDDYWGIQSLSANNPKIISLTKNFDTVDFSFDVTNLNIEFNDFQIQYFTSFDLNKVYIYYYTGNSGDVSSYSYATLDTSLLVTIGESRTLDMGYEAIGNIIPMVKAK